MSLSLTHTGEIHGVLGKSLIKKKQLQKATAFF